MNHFYRKALYINCIDVGCILGVPVLMISFPRYEGLRVVETYYFLPCASCCGFGPYHGIKPNYCSISCRPCAKGHPSSIHHEALIHLMVRCGYSKPTDFISPSLISVRVMQDTTSLLSIL